MPCKLNQEKIDAILNLFFCEHKKRKEIQQITGVSRPTINKYIEADPRYETEMKWRNENKIRKRREVWKEYQKKRRKMRKQQFEFDETYEILKKQQIIDSIDMSSHKWPSYISLFSLLISAYKCVNHKTIRKDKLEGGALIPKTLPKYLNQIHMLSEGLKKKRNTVINAANNIER